MHMEGGGGGGEGMAQKRYTNYKKFIGTKKGFYYQNHLTPNYKQATSDRHKFKERGGGGGWVGGPSICACVCVYM